MSCQAKIGVLGGLEMLHDDFRKGVLVARSEQVDYSLMLGSHNAEQRGIADAVGTNGVGFERRLFDHFNERRVFTHGEESMVETQIFAEHPPEVAFFRRGEMAVLNFLQIVDFATIRRQRNQLRGTTFDERPYDVELLNLLDAVVANRGASVGLPHDDPHRFKIRKGLPNHMALGRKSFREFLLYDPLTRRQLPKGDLFFENADDVGGP
jgi:hypothetical protein